MFLSEHSVLVGNKETYMNGNQLFFLSSQLEFLLLDNKGNFEHCEGPGWC